MNIASVDSFGLAIPKIRDIGDGSQAALPVRVQGRTLSRTPEIGSETGRVQP